MRRREWAGDRNPAIRSARSKNPLDEGFELGDQRVELLDDRLNG